MGVRRRKRDGARAAALPIVLGATALYLVARTFVLPGVPVLLGGDQGFFWMYGARMLRDERVYRDFFQFTPPGTDVVYLAAFALLGARIWVVNALVVGLGVALGGVCFRIARGIMSDAEAALAAALFTLLVFGHPLDATHHWWSMLPIMLAVLVLSPKSTSRRLAAAGAFLGIAAFFTQTHAAAALLAFLVFAAWEVRREESARPKLVVRCVLLIGSFCLALLAACAYFIATVGLRPIAASVVVYVWRHMRYAPLDRGVGLPEALTATSVRWLIPYLVVYASIPIAYGLTIALAWRGSSPRDELRRRLALIWLVGVALIAAVLPNLSWVRVFAVSMPAVILLVWALGRAGTLAHVFRWLAWTGAFVLGSFLVRSTYRHHAVFVDLPSGTVATTEANREKLPWLLEQAHAPGDLFAATRPGLYLQLGLRNPLSLDAIVPGGQTTVALVNDATHQLDARATKYILTPPVLDDPAMDEGVVAFRAYLDAHYRLVRTFPDGDEAWQRR